MNSLYEIEQLNMISICDELPLVFVYKHSQASSQMLKATALPNARASA